MEASIAGGAPKVLVSKGSPPGGTPTPNPLIRDLENAHNLRVSPNQRWVAYQAIAGGTGVNGIFIDA